MFIFDLFTIISSSPPDDSELVTRVLHGDDDAFAEIVSRHEKLVYNAAYHILITGYR